MAGILESAMIAYNIAQQLHVDKKPAAMSRKKVLLQMSSTSAQALGWSSWTTALLRVDMLGQGPWDQNQHRFDFHLLRWFGHWAAAVR